LFVLIDAINAPSVDPYVVEERHLVGAQGDGEGSPSKSATITASIDVHRSKRSTTTDGGTTIPATHNADHAVWAITTDVRLR
jgi:hypothetical protein